MAVEGGRVEEGWGKSRQGSLGLLICLGMAAIGVLLNAGGALKRNAYLQQNFSLSRLTHVSGCSPVR